MKYLILILCFLAQLVKAQDLPSMEVQINTAVLAAPAAEKAVATVLGYTSVNGALEVIRKGSGEMICLTDDPGKQGFGVSCYHRDLEPFMAKGRVLKAQGLTTKDIFDKRADEVKSGSLKMPDDPTTLFVLTAPDENYNRSTGVVDDTYLRYVIYIPYATTATTGLPLTPEAPGMPWIMDPGTHRAHIMITPPKK